MTGRGRSLAGREPITVTLPSWITGAVPWSHRFTSDEEKMRLVVALSLENVERDTGGPFAAGVFESDTGALVAVGVNSVMRLNNAALHGEMMAFMFAQQQVKSFTLDAPGLPPHELVTSCEPCAMCLGATLWSGVRRLVIGASRDDAIRVGFDEGPVFAASYRYLEERGVTVVRDVMREEARSVLELYRDRAGSIYNG